MANNYRTNLPHKTGYPGDGMYYVLCDICGIKMRAKDAVYIQDKFSDKSRLLVCPCDADITNPQSFIKSFRERQISNPRLIRSEGADVFVDSGEVGRTSSAPQHLTTVGATSSTITLQWLPPEDPGSSAISGYQIERESPIGGGFSVITTTTVASGWFDDSGLTSSTVYNYRVSAVNSEGIGDASNEASNTTS